METNPPPLPPKKHNLFALVGFIVCLPPVIGVCLILLIQNKAEPMAHEVFLESFVFRPAVVYAIVGTTLSSIALFQIRKTKSKGKAFAIAAIVIGIITSLFYYAFTKFQQDRMNAYELRVQQEIQMKKPSN